jgi:hypothetical protein
VTNPATGRKVPALRVRGEHHIGAIDEVLDAFLPVVVRQSYEWSWEGGGEFVVTEAATKRRVVLFRGGDRPGEWFEPLRFTPDGRGFLAMATTVAADGPRKVRHERRVVLWNLETGKPEREVPLPRPTVPEEPRRQFEPHFHFSPDGSQVVWLVHAAVRPDAPDRVWTAAEALLAPAELHVWDVSPDGEFSGHTRHTLDWVRDPTSDSRASDAGRWAHAFIPPDGFSDRWLILTGSWHTLVFDLRARKLLPVCRTRGQPRGLVVADDGTRLFHFVGDELRVYDLRTGEEVASLPVPVSGQYRKEDQPLRHEAGRLVFAGYKGYRPTPEEARVLEMRLEEDDDTMLPLRGTKGRSVEFEYVLDGTPPGE